MACAVMNVIPSWTGWWAKAKGKLQWIFSILFECMVS